MDRYKQVTFAYGFFLGLLLVLPVGYAVKALTEPPGWFLLSKYYPWLTLAVNESLAVGLALFFRREKRRLQK